MTGAVPPSGCDTVVMQEVVRVDGERAVIPGGQRRGQNIRRAGEDLALGGRR
jgi:molybdopterin molybdotransferase